MFHDKPRNNVVAWKAIIIVSRKRRFYSRTQFYKYYKRRIKYYKYYNITNDALNITNITI